MARRGFAGASSRVTALASHATRRQEDTTGWLIPDRMWPPHPGRRRLQEGDARSWFGEGLLGWAESVGDLLEFRVGVHLLGVARPSWELDGEAGVLDPGEARGRGSPDGCSCHWRVRWAARRRSPGTPPCRGYQLARRPACHIRPSARRSVDGLAAVDDHLDPVAVGHLARLVPRGGVAWFIEGVACRTKAPA